MNVILYSTGCANCKALEAKLKTKNITYEKIEDMKTIEEKGFMSVPMLEVDGKTFNYQQASIWLRNLEVEE